jgi:hypothetical protein
MIARWRNLVLLVLAVASEEGHAQRHSDEHYFFVRPGTLVEGQPFEVVAYSEYCHYVFVDQQIGYGGVEVHGDQIDVRVGKVAVISCDVIPHLVPQAVHALPAGNYTVNLIYQEAFDSPAIEYEIDEMSIVIGPRPPEPLPVPVLARTTLLLLIGLFAGTTTWLSFCKR